MAYVRVWKSYLVNLDIARDVSGAVCSRVSCPGSGTLRAGSFALEALLMFILAL